MADVTDSKSVGSDTVWVRVPPSAPLFKSSQTLDRTGFASFLFCVVGLILFSFYKAAFNCR